MTVSQSLGPAQSDWELLTVAEVAEELNVSEMTVRNWIDSGELAVLRVGSRRLRVQRSALAAHLGIELPTVAPTRLASASSQPQGAPFDREAVAAS